MQDDLHSSASTLSVKCCIRLLCIARSGSSASIEKIAILVLDVNWLGYDLRLVRSNSRLYRCNFTDKKAAIDAVLPSCGGRWMII